MKTMRLPLSAVEGVLFGESADSAPKAPKWFRVDVSLPILPGDGTFFTVSVLAIDAEAAKVSALGVLIRNVKFVEIKEVENG